MAYRKIYSLLLIVSIISPNMVIEAIHTPNIGMLDENDPGGDGSISEIISWLNIDTVKSDYSNRLDHKPVVAIIDQGLSYDMAGKVNFISNYLKCASTGCEIVTNPLINNDIFSYDSHGDYVLHTLFQVVESTATVDFYRVSGQSVNSVFLSVLKALDYMIDNTEDRPHIINLSIGRPSNDIDDQTRDEIEQRLHTLRQLGVIIFAAAGNSGNSVEHFPAYSTAVEAIASFQSDFTDANSNVGEHATTSTYAGYVDFTMPDLVEVEKVVVHPDGNFFVNYVAAGTSFATPIIVGMVALIYSIYYDVNSEWPSRDDIINVLYDHAEPRKIVDGVERVVEPVVSTNYSLYHTDKFGYGIIDILDIINEILNPDGSGGDDGSSGGGCTGPRCLTPY